MKIDNSKLDVLLARRCMTIADLRKEASSQTLTRIRRGESVKPITAGKIALALGVDVTDIIENTAATVDNGKQGDFRSKMKQFEQSAAMLQHSPQNQNQDEVLENIGKGGLLRC